MEDVGASGDVGLEDIHEDVDETLPESDNSRIVVELEPQPSMSAKEPTAVAPPLPPLPHVVTYFTHCPIAHGDPHWFVFRV